MDVSIKGDGARGFRLPQHPALRGLCLSLLSATLGLLALSLLRLALPARLWGVSAAQGLTDKPDGYIFFFAILFAPLFETVLGQLLPIELARRCRAGQRLCIVISAAVFGFGHYYNGGIAHGVTTFVAGAVFAYAYVSTRAGGVGASYVATVAAHAGHNALLLYLLAPLLPD